MAGAWSARVVKSKDGSLNFAMVRFRPMENKASGVSHLWGGKTIDEMRLLAKELDAACDRSVIDLENGIDQDAVDEEEEYDND